MIKHLFERNERPYETWQLDQLAQLAQSDPARVERMMNSLWELFPALYEELAIQAATCGEITSEACAERLGQTPERMNEMLDQVQKRQLSAHRCILFDNETGIAKLGSSQIAVWEIVREYRKLGSVENLLEAFPSLSKQELAAAMRYAQENPAETENLIARYEKFHRQVTDQYPNVS